MNNQKAHFVFITDEAAKFLEMMVFVTPHLCQIENYHYLVCSKVNEDSIHFLALTFPPTQGNYSYELALPYQYVLYIFSGEEKNLDKSLVFRNKPSIADNPQGKPACS